MTRSEGEDLVEYLRTISADQWNAPTVCAPWTVRHLVAHLTALSNQTLPNFARRMITTGFSFQKLVDGDLQKYLASPDEMIATLARSVAAPTTPKMLDHIALGEFLCHGEDIRRALGARGEHPAEHITEVGPEYVKSGKPLLGKTRVEGLSLRATDGDFRWGQGQEVAGPGIDLILAIAGRSDALDTCEGPGVETMRSRC